MGIAVVDDKLEAALKYSRDVDGVGDKPEAARMLMALLTFQEQHGP